MKTSIADLVRSANQELSMVAIAIHGSRFYFRGTKFPPKLGDAPGKRYEIPTKLRANPRELKIVLARAKEIDAALMLNRFKWEPYLSPKARSPQTTKDWVERFEQNYWSTRDQTLNRQNTWRKSYRQYFDALPEQDLSEELLIETLKKYPVHSRSRQLCAVAYGMLAKFAGLPNAQISDLGKGYRSPPKTKADILTDEQIVFQVENCEHPGWRWVASMAATFGLRDHEIARLDTTRIREGIVRVLPDSKTGDRTVYACPFEWVERFKLWDVQLPNIKVEDRSNNAIGSSISAGFKRCGLSRFYSFRDAYAIRLEFHFDSRTPTPFKSRWMGHSAAVHDKHYLDAIQEIDHERMYEQLRQSKNSE